VISTSQKMFLNFICQDAIEWLRM